MFQVKFEATILCYNILKLLLPNNYNKVKSFLCLKVFIKLCICFVNSMNILIIIIDMCDVLWCDVS